MLAEQMRHRPEHYEETDDPHNPPVSTGIAPVLVAGLWYYLAPIALLVLVVGFAFIYWGSRAEAPADKQVVGTTGKVEEATPGGFDPGPRFRTTADEIKFRADTR